MSENFREPQSANEAILQNILGAQNELREPQSVVEFYLQKILEQGSGSSVIANPTLEGTESALSGLEVDGTKYKVESGGGSAAHLYEHNCYVGNGIDPAIRCQIYTADATPFNKNTLIQWLLQNMPGGQIQNISRLATGTVQWNGERYAASMIAALADGSNLSITGYGSEKTLFNFGMNAAGSYQVFDTVIQIL